MLTPDLEKLVVGESTRMSSMRFVLHVAISCTESLVPVEGCGSRDHSIIAVDGDKPSMSFCRREAFVEVAEQHVALVVELGIDRHQQQE